MSAPTKRLEELILSRKIAHAGHPVLRWMAGNVSLETDAADNWKPSKKRSPERIDGIVAAIMAVGGIIGDKEELCHDLSLGPMCVG